MPKTQEITQNCIKLIAEVKRIDPESISPDATFEEIGLDSLDRVSLAFDIEEAYGIQIPESALSKIQSVPEMAAGIEEALAKKDDSSVEKSA